MEKIYETGKFWVLNESDAVMDNKTATGSVTCAQRKMIKQNERFKMAKKMYYFRGAYWSHYWYVIVEFEPLGMICTGDVCSEFWKTLMSVAL